MPTTHSIRLCTLKWMRMHRFSLPIEVRGGLIGWYLYLRLCFPECSLDDLGRRPLVGGVANFKSEKEPLLVVSRGSTRSEEIQTADLLSGTMRRISRARSIVSGVEL